MQAAVFIGLEDERAQLGELALLLVSNGNEVDGFSGESIHRAHCHSPDPCEDKVTELFGLLEMSNGLGYGQKVDLRF